MDIQGSVMKNYNWCPLVLTHIINSCIILYIYIYMTVTMERSHLWIKNTRIYYSPFLSFLLMFRNNFIIENVFCHSSTVTKLTLLKCRLILAYINFKTRKDFDQFKVFNSPWSLLQAYIWCWTVCIPLSHLINWK
jgi:hypothetical protein